MKAYPPPVGEGSDARFVHILDRGCKGGKALSGDYQTSIQECANDCAAKPDECTAFMYGKIGWDKEGHCKLHSGDCEDNPNKGNYMSYQVLDADHVIDLENPE